jgi:hypothetical protein
MGLNSAAGNKLEKMVRKGNTLSTLVKVGRHSCCQSHPLCCPRSRGAFQPASF